MVRSIGLTGGIGSGKSTVAGFFVDAGARLVDTDAIARDLTGPNGDAMPAIAAAFGPALVAPDGALDREGMRRLAFGDPLSRRRLEGILHPLIGRRALAQAALAAADGMVVFDVPLLTESGHWRGRVDRVLVVDCSVRTQVSRVVRRPGWDEEAAQRVIANQATRHERLRIADAVIVNDGIGLDDLALQVQALHAAWQDDDA